NVSELDCGIAKRGSDLVRVLRDGGGQVIPDVRREGRHQHQRALEVLPDAVAVWLMPTTQCSRKEAHASARSLTDCSRLKQISGLYTFSSKLPEAPPMLTATSLASTCAQTMVSASDWVGFTLPGMMLLPGSFSGIRSSPSPARGPDASQRTSLAIFVSAAA